MNKKSKINICYFIGSLNIGGTERNVVNIVKNIDKNRFNTFVYVLGSGGPLEENLKQTGIPYFFGNFTFRRRDLWKAYLYFIWFLLKKRIHILHSLGYPTIYYGINAGRIARVPALITTIQDYDCWKTEKEIEKDKKVYKYATKIIADGRGAMEFAIKQQGVSQEKFEVIYDGVNTDELKQTKNLSDLKKELGLAENNKIIGIIARLDNKKKGQEYFIKAIPAVIKNHTDARFLIVGDGADENILKKLAHEIGINNKIIFSGSRTDLGDIIRIIDILVIPSIWESIPKILLEAMYLKRMVITTNVGDIPEIIEDGQNGFLIEPESPEIIAQKINYCMENSEQCLKMTENAYKTIINRSLTLEKSVKKLENLYKNLIKI